MAAVAIKAVCTECDALWREFEPNEPDAHCVNHSGEHAACDWCGGCDALPGHDLLCEACWLSTK